MITSDGTETVTETVSGSGAEAVAVANPLAVRMRPRRIRLVLSSKSPQSVENVCAAITKAARDRSNGAAGGDPDLCFRVSGPVRLPTISEQSWKKSKGKSKGKGDDGEGSGSGSGSGTAPVPAKLMRIHRRQLDLIASPEDGLAEAAEAALNDMIGELIEPGCKAMVEVADADDGVGPGATA